MLIETLCLEHCLRPGRGKDERLTSSVLNTTMNPWDELGEPLDKMKPISKVINLI
ncbi:hypothetical protein [Metallosphaera sp.]|uniref:hypothetical protein n=1 Tax=Metallosphaera sp. TaxID=2020860 RepID=UPI0031666C34